jgi:site-specific DNA-methyltransferase (adenine-specific)
MARKPISEKTVAENCLKYGTGGINIDECRVEIDFECGGRESAKNTVQKTSGISFKGNIKDSQETPLYNPSGRFPANLIHDNSEEVRECFPETKSKGHFPSNNKNGNSIFNTNNLEQEEQWLDDSGNASRFFKSIIYQAKASKSERNCGLDVIEDKNKRPQGEAFGDGSAITEHSERKGNFHPTVKPIALMEYLIKMVTPKGGIVLDPFAGSGSTLIAAKQNGFKYIGIELTEEYIPIIKARLSSIRQQTLL